nr:terminase family protein [Cognatiyoonia koreensis]
MRSGARLIASAPPTVQANFLSAQSEHEIAALEYLWEFWAMPHQLPPDSDWRNWVILGGRGAGKTRAGAEWVRTKVAEGARRLAIVGDTFDQAKEVMVFGESGIMSVYPPGGAPDWIATRRTLIWPNGAELRVFSAQDPEMLRGPQFDTAWVDELAKWRNGQSTWDMLQFCMRLGDSPQVCITTTPQNVPVLRDLLSDPATVQTHATTYANAANLAPSYLAQVTAKYGGTRLGRQELEGELLSDVAGAFWSLAQLDQLVVSDVPDLDRIVVAVDPPATSKSTSDECGIVVAGVARTGRDGARHVYVLEDASVSRATPNEWARAAISAMARHKADRIVAEVNQGGDMVKSTIHTLDPNAPFRAVHATRAKVARAEPVSALYEEGRVRHADRFVALHDQMALMSSDGYQGRGSPDRVDALVWAIHDLEIGRTANASAARIRSL